MLQSPPHGCHASDSVHALRSLLIKLFNSYLLLPPFNFSYIFFLTQSNKILSLFFVLTKLHFQPWFPLKQCPLNLTLEKTHWFSQSYQTWMRKWETTFPNLLRHMRKLPFGKNRFLFLILCITNCTPFWDLIPQRGHMLGKFHAFFQAIQPIFPLRLKNMLSTYLSWPNLHVCFDQHYLL